MTGRRDLPRLPHPAIICNGPQLLAVIEGMEAGAYPLPDVVVWRDDLPGDLAVRLAKATGGTEDQIAGIKAVLAAEAANRAEYVHRTVAGWPPLTPDAIEDLARLINDDDPYPEA